MGFQYITFTLSNIVGALGFIPHVYRPWEIFLDSLILDMLLDATPNICLDCFKRLNHIFSVTCLLKCTEQQGKALFLFYFFVLIGKV